jgi:hypothetical protein
LLTFYSAAALASVYVRNAIVCEGILSDVIALCAKSEDPVIQTVASHAIYSFFSGQEPVSQEELELGALIGLLNIAEPEALYFVLLTLIELVVANFNCISEFHALNVHVLLH